MKLVDGGSLAGRTPRSCPRETGLSPRASATLVATVARAVHYAHERGILHRDLKPANILLAAPRMEGTSPARRTSPSPGRAIWESLMSRTSAWPSESEGEHADPVGDIVGTPPYMAPEQVSCRKDAVTTATELTVGSLLYAALSGAAAVPGG